MSRKLKRQIQKSNGEMAYKKVLAKKLGCSLAELEERMARREKNLKEYGGKKDE